jgi:hypothetical protein
MDSILLSSFGSYDWWKEIKEKELSQNLRIYKTGILWDQQFSQLN